MAPELNILAIFAAVSYASFFLVGFGFGPPYVAFSTSLANAQRLTEKKNSQGLILAVAQLAVVPELSGIATAVRL